MFFLDQDANRISFPINRFQSSTSIRVIQYKCKEDGNFYSADYQFETKRIGSWIEGDRDHFAFEERIELPLKNSVESNNINPSSVITNKFANEIKVYIYESVGLPRKLSLFTNTIDNDVDLEVVNQVNNRDLIFHESIELGGQEFLDVYSAKLSDDVASRIYYSKEKGLIRFTDIDENILTLDTIIFR